MLRREAGRTSGPTTRATGERGTPPGNEGQVGNPDSIYRRTRCARQARRIPSIPKQANSAASSAQPEQGRHWHVGRRRPAEIEKWQNVGRSP
jgi:hypothetical protein